jgi:hypothetical protein
MCVFNIRLRVSARLVILVWRYLLRLRYLSLGSWLYILMSVVLCIKVNINQSLYRPGVSQRVPGS